MGCPLPPDQVVPVTMVELSGDPWMEINGPATGVGEESWYENMDTGDVAYVCDDQGVITIDVRPT